MGVSAMKKDAPETDRVLSAAEIGRQLGALAHRRRSRDDRPVVSDDEAAARFGRRKIKSGEIAGFEQGGRYYAHQSDVDRYIAGLKQDLRRRVRSQKAAADRSLVTQVLNHVQQLVTEGKTDALNALDISNLTAQTSSRSPCGATGSSQDSQRSRNVAEGND